MTKLTVHVPGRPQPQGSKRVVHGRLIDANAATLQPWRALVTHEAAAALRQTNTWRNDAAMQLDVLFRFARPRSHLRANGLVKPGSPAHMVVRPDIDKLVRAVCDALTDAAVWLDDCQVMAVTASKLYAPASVSVGATICVTNCGVAQ